MVADRDSEFSSPFDVMLEKDRARLERLYCGPSPEPDRPATTLQPAPAMSAPPPRPAARAEPARSRLEIRGFADGIPFSVRPSE